MIINQLPLLGITMGDPGGIGPEICVKTLNDPEIYRICRPLVIGDMDILADAVRFCRMDLSVSSCSSADEGRYTHGTIDTLSLNKISLKMLKHKQVTAEQGEASFAYVEKAIDMAIAGEIDGTVTGPINKAAIHAAGHLFAGHTEIYATKTDTRDYAMMLTHGNFRVTHVSTHVSLREACDRVKKDRIDKVIDLTHDALQKIGLPHPCIGVAGLNPHCGEDRMFGNEDVNEIRPAVEAAVLTGKQVEGPIPADTVFPKMKGGMYDAVVVMYHDQGHIPMKLLGFQYNQKTGQWGEMSGVNVTLGLPIVRTSVDHGTAFGKAGEGRANPQSMIEAIRLGALLSGKPES